MPVTVTDAREHSEGKSAPSHAVRQTLRRSTHNEPSGGPNAMKESKAA